MASRIRSFSSLAANASACFFALLSSFLWISSSRNFTLRINNRNHQNPRAMPSTEIISQQNGLSQQQSF